MEGHKPEGRRAHAGQPDYYVRMSPLERQDLLRGMEGKWDHYEVIKGYYIIWVRRLPAFEGASLRCCIKLPIGIIAIVTRLNPCPYYY